MEILGQLIQNAALLMTLALAYSLFIARYPRDRKTIRLLNGLLFGAVAVIGMLYPVQLAEGLIFDGRTVIVGLAGVFGGLLSAGVAALVAAAYRGWLGGGGVVMGVGTILTAAALGAVFHWLRQAGKLRLTAWSLLAFGVAVHLLALAWVVTLPTPFREQTLNNIALPYLLVLPGLTLVLGLFLQSIEQRVDDSTKLRESERRLEEASRLVGLGYWEWDLATDRHLWSEGVYRLFDLDPGRPPPGYSEVRRYFSDQSSQALNDAIERCIADATPYQVEAEIVLPDGRRRWINASGEAVQDTSGRTVTLRGTAQDISGSKQMREDLVREQGFLSTLVHTIPDLVWLKDPQGVYLACNPRFERFFGAKEAQILGRTDYDFMSKADADFFRHHDLKALEAGAPTINEETITFADDGHQELLETVKTPMCDANGELVGVLGIARDITEQRRNAEELEIHRQHLEKLVAERTAELEEAHRQMIDTHFAMDQAGIGIHWVDADSGRILYVNNHAAQMLGYSVDQLLELSIPDIDPNFPSGDFKRLTQSMFADGSAHFESQQKRKDGSLVPVDVYGYLRSAEDGKSSRIITFVSDISERKQAEQQLLAAKAAAEQANLAKSAFLANMSHEIRTPLHAITGMAHLVRRGGLTPRQAEQMDKLESAGEHLLYTINAILELSKIEAGKFNLDNEPVSPRALVQEVQAMLQEQARAKGLRLQSEVAPIPDGMLGDPTRLRQALLNYATNAVKFTDTGSVTIRVSRLAEDSSGVLLRFEVEDTGIGIPAAVMPRLFNTFEQADSSMTRRYGGSGLGLAITRKFAELMGGEAGVQSAEGKGSTFWFTARLARSESPAPAPECKSDDAEQLVRSQHGERRVLLAEDEPVNREIISFILEDVGVAVDLAEDGEKAVQAARETDYDLILMDMQMPVLDGLGATRAIRNLPGHRNTPILALTANAFAEDRQRCLSAGMDDFLAKPIEPSVFFAKLLAWFEKSSKRPG